MVGILRRAKESPLKTKNRRPSSRHHLRRQKVEHYEIASYGSLRAWALLLGNEEAANLIEEILDQEKDADNTLNELAPAKNKEALDEVEVGAGASA